MQYDLQLEYYYKCSPDSDCETSLKIGQYSMKLRRMKLKRTKECASFFGPPCIKVTVKVQHLYKLHINRRRRSASQTGPAFTDFGLHPYSHTYF